ERGQVEVVQARRDGRRVMEVIEEWVHAEAAQAVAEQLQQLLVVVGGQPVVCPGANQDVDHVAVSPQVRADLVKGVVVSFHALNRKSTPSGDAVAGLTAKQAGFQLPAPERLPV